MIYYDEAELEKIIKKHKKKGIDIFKHFEEAIDKVRKKKTIEFGGKHK